MTPLRGQTPPLSVAPMMERTDRHFRYMMRQISRHTLLYTEMVVTWSAIKGDKDRLLGFHESEHPVSLQLGGDDPKRLAKCARMAADFGYDEVNLNVGCPSDRVKKGNFGVILMGQPERVARCVAAMRTAVDMPITVKHRIGFDHTDKYEDMHRFVRIVSEAGADRFTVHARKAWIEGLSPKQNRNVPPLRYGEVHRLKAEFPHLPIEINGGIRTFDQAAAQLEHVDAVMIGRAAYDTPWIFAEADSRFFGDDHARPTRRQVVEAMADHADDWLRKAPHLRMGPVAKPLLNLYAGVPGAKHYRRHLSEHAFRLGAGPQVLVDAVTALESRRLAG